MSRLIVEAPAWLNKSEKLKKKEPSMEDDLSERIESLKKKTCSTRLSDKENEPNKRTSTSSNFSNDTDIKTFSIDTNEDFPTDIEVVRKIGLVKSDKRPLRPDKIQHQVKRVRLEVEERSVEKKVVRSY